LIENYPCNSKTELERREGEYTKANKCVNEKIAGRTMTEWREDNKEYIKEYTKKWYENNKEKTAEIGKQYYENNKELILEKIAEKVTCECGCIVRKGNLTRHKKSNKHLELIK